MIDVIIPTMWRSKRLEHMLKEYNDHELIDNIFLINNKREDKNIDLSQFEKVLEITPASNMYVNPAWNLGARISRNDLITIVNDDVTFSTIYFDFIAANKNEIGLLGLDISCYLKSATEPIPPVEGMEIHYMDNHKYGWGCLISMRRKHWIDIPHDVKVFYGDNCMFRDNPVQCKMMTGLKIQTEMSTTSAQTWVQDIFLNDQEVYFKMMNQINKNFNP